MSRRKNFEQFQSDLFEVTTSRDFKGMIRRKLTYPGALHFRDYRELWIFMVLQQALMLASTIAAIIAGFMIWSPILFMVPVLAMFSTAFLYRSYLDLSERGWGDAIIALERKRNKLETYNDQGDPDE